MSPAYMVYSVPLPGLAFFGITANFETRPDLDLADAARDEPVTWIGARLKTMAPNATQADFRIVETHDTLFGAIAFQIQHVARCRTLMRDALSSGIAGLPYGDLDDMPCGYFPADEGLEVPCEEFAVIREKMYPRPWMSDEAAVYLERNIVQSERDAKDVFYLQDDLANLLARFYKETLIRRRTWASSAAAYDIQSRNVVFKTGGTYPNDWDAASPTEFAETATTWICDRAEQFALRLLSGQRCENPKVDMDAMRTLARDALRMMYETVGNGTTALDVARTRVSRFVSDKQDPNIRGDLVRWIQEAYTDEMDENTRVYNIRMIMPKDHPARAARRKSAPPSRQMPAWPPVVVPEAFANLGKRKKKPEPEPETETT